MKINSLFSCSISSNTVVTDGQIVFSSQSDNAEIFLKELYYHLNLDYLKFFKMDTLSKIGFLGVEIMNTYCQDLKKFSDDEISLIFANRHSSLDTDERFWNGVTSDQPIASPSLFVYTLPSIMLGEIAIRNKWTGENLFLISEEYDYAALEDLANLYFQTGKSNACIIAWVDLYNNNCNAVFNLLAKTK